jgi:hypothetical protein
MSKFAIKKHLSLAFLGEGWENAYIDFTPVSMTEITGLIKLESSVSRTDTSGDNVSKAEAVIAKAREVMRDHFTAGMGYTGTKDEAGAPKLEAITVEDATDELFNEIYVPFIKLARGIVDQNL